MDLKEYEQICRLGAAVEIKNICMGEPVGTRGLVYEVYQIPGCPSLGVSIVSETGKDWSGWSKEDIRWGLRWIGEVPGVPECKSSRQLWKAKDAGLFVEPLRMLKELVPPPVYYNGAKKNQPRER